MREDARREQSEKTDYKRVENPEEMVGARGESEKREREASTGSGRHVSLSAAGPPLLPLAPCPFMERSLLRPWLQEDLSLGGAPSAVSTDNEKLINRVISITFSH